MSGDDGRVVPFTPRRPAPAPDPALAGLHRRTKQARRRAQQLAADQARPQRDAYDAATRRQRDEQLLAEGVPVPMRITRALDIAGLDGPEVDEQVGTYEGNPDGDVDDWEAGRAIPSGEQVRMLVELTGFPISFFYRAPSVHELGSEGGTWISWSGGRGCELVPADVIDERGVLLRGGELPAPARDVQVGLFPASSVPVVPAGPRATTPGRDGTAPTRPSAGPPLDARAEIAAAIARGKARWKR